MGYLEPGDKIVEAYENEHLIKRIIAAVDENGFFTAADFKESIARAREDAARVDTFYHH